MAQCDVNDLREFIASNFLFSDEFYLSDTTSFLESGVIDSTGVVQLIDFLEERYEIKLAAEEVVPENLDSIQRLKSFVERKLNGKQTPTTMKESN
jgi:acyl carrier protein